MSEQSVDEFVQSRVLPELRPIVAMLRDLMKECAPSVTESISYGIPAFKGKRILAVISPTKQDITFSFSRGAQFEDKYGLLRGVGKSSKHVKIKSLSKANLEALRYYIAQALDFDTK
jgi:uncharacterized protein YdhG (YjbR/CyaY superfamily)